jgi:uncharacterized protein
VNRYHAEMNPMKRTRIAAPMLLALLLVSAASACAREEPPADGTTWVSAIAFDTAVALVMTATDTIRLTVEVAERDAQRSHGLMERLDLPQDAGMIFLYQTEQPADAGFWMYRTRIPLDIAFFDEDGVIGAILAMDPCPYEAFRCPTYPPGVPYFGALEVNRGWFAARGVSVGDRIVLQR